MNTNLLFKRYIWLIDTILSAGSISLAEIEARWQRSTLNDDNSVLDRRTFHRYRVAIAEIWGIDIVCDHSTSLYSLTNLGDLGQGSTQTWMADSFAIQNMITHTRDLRDRVIFERIPAGTRFMSLIVSAMTEGHKLQFTYQRFGAEPHTFLLQPYCLKAFKQRWYVVGKPDDHPEEKQPRVYALDRIVDVQLTEEPYRMPASFSAQKFFRDYYGIDRREQPQTVEIRVGATDANYLRSLPLHHSQQETSRMADSSVFRYRIAPTYDFIQELRKLGPNVEILQPASLRQRFADDARMLLEKNK